MSQQNQDGYIVLITMLILGAIVSVVTGFLLITGQGSSIASTSVVANTNAKAAANGCAQLALGAIQATPTLSTPSTANHTLNTTTKQTCTYTITGASPNFTIAVTGTSVQGSNSYVHRMTITTNQVTPSINTTSWQDTP